MTADESGQQPDQGADGAHTRGGEDQESVKGSDVAEKADGHQARDDRGEKPDPVTVGVQSAFDLGWTMAGLANDATATLPLGDLKRSLPTEHELSRSPRARLEVVRLECLITSLETLFPPQDEAIPSSHILGLKADLDPQDPEWDTVGRSLEALHLDTLAYLACLGRTILLAYQVGRSLHDTVLRPVQDWADELQGKDRAHGQELPQTLTALTEAFGRGRIAVLQEWLATLAPHFPDQGASVVKASLGRWSEWVTAAFVAGTPGKVKGARDDKAAVVDQAAQALLRQGDVWLNILVGTESLEGLLTPEANVAAGEEALSRSARIVRRVALHYWVAILIIVAAAGALIALSAVYLEGAGKVWTQIATVVGALGVTAKGIGTRVGRLADAGEKPIYRAAEVDALAWAVTTLPTAALSLRGVHALRRAGIQGSAPLGRA
jgi:hypothetical protein